MQSDGVTEDDLQAVIDTAVRHDMQQAARRDLRALREDDRRPTHIQSVGCDEQATLDDVAGGDA